MIPYIPTTKPMKGEEQEALMSVLIDLENIHGSYPTTRLQKLQTANEIIREGFARRIPQKVSQLQLWSYASETSLLAYASYVLYSLDRPFAFGGLVALTLGSLLTFAGGLIINNGIKRGFRP